MELIQVDKKEVCNVLDSYNIEAYVVAELDEMAGNFAIVFPIGAQLMRLQELAELEMEFLEYFTSSNISISKNNVVILLL